MSVLFTGASGFLGSRVLRELLAENTPEPITVLGRGTPQELRERVESAVTWLRAPALGPGALDRLRYATADLALPDLGLAEAERARLTDGVTTVWHCAALLDLLGDPSGLFRANVLGTRRVLELAEEAPAAQLLYVSTAFVAGGRRAGHVMEDELSDSEGFQTYYEETKYTAERMIRTWAGRNERAATVLRPSLLLTDRPSPPGVPGQTLDVLIRLIDNMLPSGHTAPDDGLPSPDDALDGGVPAGRDSTLPFRVRGDPDAAMNAVQVDYAARVMARVAAARRGEGGVRTVHVTHPHNTVFEIAKVALESLYPGLLLTVTPTVPAPTRIEALAMEYCGNLLGFGTQQRTYDRTQLLRYAGDLPEPAPVDSEYVMRALNRTVAGSEVPTPA